MFAYVVLHFRTLQLTAGCVGSLRNLFPQSRVVVVDNGSADGSGQALQAMYQDCAMVDVLISPSNLGFARGNNLGYCFAVNNYAPDYVAVMNNDVVVSQPEFEQEISGYMQSQGIDVCGPDIQTPGGGHQNPLMDKPFPAIRIIKQMCIDLARLACLRLGLLEGRIMGAYNAVSEGYQKHQPARAAKNCIVHGACIVYGRRYTSQVPFAFVPETFLYGEEMILYDFCQRCRFTTGVCPGASLLHLGGKSTMAAAGQRQRQIFKISQNLKSMLQLLRLRIMPGKYQPGKISAPSAGAQNP